MCPFTMGFPGGSENKEFTCNAGNLGSVSGMRRFPGEGNSYLLQYFGLENSTDRGAWWATIHGLAKSRTQLSDFHMCKIVCILWELTHLIMTNWR